MSKRRSAPTLQSMQGMGIGTPDRKWYYLIWPTYRRRPIFKIPGTARICEQLIRRTLVRPSWRLDCVAMRPDTLHLLVHAPSSLTRDLVHRQLRDWIDATIRRSHVVALPRGALWGHGAWCGVLKRPRAVRMARQRISALAAPRPFPRTDGLGNPLVRQEPAGRVDNIDRLGQYEVLQRRRIR